MIRDLLLGRSRFRDFTESPEGIPTNILSDRLERMIDGGLVRKAYALTEKGQALWPVVVALRDWGLTWEPGTQASMQGSSPDGSLDEDLPQT